jgi:hypothetical protein
MVQKVRIYTCKTDRQRQRLTHREKTGVSQAPLAEVLPRAYYLGKGPNSHEAPHHADSLHLHCVLAR